MRGRGGEGILARLAHVCQLRGKPVIGESSIDYAASELNKGSRPFTRPYSKPVCAPLVASTSKFAPYGLPIDGALTRKDKGTVSNEVLPRVRLRYGVFLGSKEKPSVTNAFLLPTP